MRYQASKRVRVMSGLMWFVVGFTAAVLVACVVMTIKVNSEMGQLGL